MEYELIRVNHEPTVILVLSADEYWEYWELHEGDRKERYLAVLALDGRVPPTRIVSSKHGVLKPVSMHEDCILCVYEREWEGILVRQAEAAKNSLALWMRIETETSIAPTAPADPVSSTPTSLPRKSNLQRGKSAKSSPASGAEKNT